MRAELVELKDKNICAKSLSQTLICFLKITVHLLRISCHAKVSEITIRLRVTNACIYCNKVELCKTEIIMNYHITNSTVLIIPIHKS